VLSKTQILPISMLLLAAIVSQSQACPGGTVNEATRHFNPCPEGDDFNLPMPGNIHMAFRKVIVPGKDFWGDSNRIVKLGDPTGGILQSQRTVMVGGAFHPSSENDWHFFLGKYEVTKAQFVQVMGEGNIQDGIKRLQALSGDPEDQKLSQLTEKELLQKLAFPVAWVGWLGIQEFISKYNLWCLNDSACKGSLPEIKAETDKEGMKGFVRLPTEMEWEYAARGASIKADDFNKELPFKKDEIDKYAVVKGAGAKILRVGTREPTPNNLYDMFGNVQELTGDAFQAEMGQGKAGALTARGGSVDTEKKDLRSSYRTEVPFYQVMSSGKISQSNASTGFRLVLVAPVIPTAKYRAQIEQAHQEYLATLRNATPAGQSLLNGSVVANQDLGNVTIELGKLLGKPNTSSDPKELLHLVEELKDGIQKTKTQLEDTSQKIDIANQKICDSHIKHGVFISLLMVRTKKDIMTKNKLLDILSQKSNKTAQEQFNIDQLTESVKKLEEQITFYYQRYVDDLGSLAECGERTSQKGINNFKIQLNRGIFSDVEKECFQYFVVHYNQFRQKNAANPQWVDEIFAAFQEKKLLMQI